MEKDLIAQIIETWQIHNRINLYLLKAIPDEGLSARPEAKRQGRTVAQQFAHMHNVRLAWFMKSQADIIGKLKIIDREKAENKKLLVESFTKSGEMIENFLRKSLSEGLNLKDFKPHTVAFIGYLISHESHHRGSIMLALKQSGFKIPQGVQPGIWEWGKR
ncbi:MAG: DinB family protein [Ignavibacteria bacterium]